jgi:nucleotide-binding universal stress UspA family protein
MLPVRTILHPTDFSETADYAYRVARLIARECGARLVVLHVAGMCVDVSPVVYSEMGVPFILPGEYQAYHAALKGQLREKFETDREIRVETHLRDGDAAEEILRLADQVACDLIVVGTHGRSGLPRLLVGSVAEAVLRRARCPVLTVKTPAAALSTETGKPGREAVIA